MASAPLDVRLGELLYRTRGRDWDYAFLLQPEPLLGEGWYALHRSIFKGVEPDVRPCLLRGALGVGLGHPFFATAFTDAERCDFQGRPIAHYLTWLGPRAEAAPGLSFGPAVVRALAPALEQVFELAPGLVTRGETKALDTLIRQRFLAALAALPQRELAIQGDSGLPLQWLGTITP